MLLNTDNQKSYYLTDLDGKKIDFSERLKGKLNIMQRAQLLGSLLNDFPLIPINTDLKREFKIMKEVIGELQNADFMNVKYDTLEGDFTELTKTWNVSKYTKISLLDEGLGDTWNNSAITKAIFLIYLRAEKLLNTLYSEIKNRAENYKLFGANKTFWPSTKRTAQPAKKQTTAETLEAIKKGQRVSGIITDTTDGKNITKLIREAIKKFQLIGTPSDEVEKSIPTLKEGFAESDLIIHIKAGLRKKIKEYDVSSDGEKFAMTMSPRGKNLDKRVNSIDGIILKDSFWLPENVLFVIFTKRVAMYQFPTYPKATEIFMARGGGGKSVVEKDNTLRNTHSSEVFLDFTSFYRTLVCYPGEAIFVLGNS